MASDPIFPRAFIPIEQGMGFRFGWETVARYVGPAGHNPEETLEIRRIILEQTRAALGGCHPEVNNG